MSKRFPKRGFRTNRFNTYEDLTEINLGRIAYFIQKGFLDPSETITMRKLVETGVCSKIKHGVKLLGKGSEKLETLAHNLNTPINFEVTNASQSAIDAVGRTGGTLSVVYRTPLIMR